MKSGGACLKALAWGPSGDSTHGTSPRPSFVNSRKRRDYCNKFAPCVETIAGDGMAVARVNVTGVLTDIRLVSVGFSTAEYEMLRPRGRADIFRMSYA